MIREIRYLTSAMMMPAFDYTLKANQQFVVKDYEIALYFYDQALKNNPTDKDNLYKRSICKKMLGNIAGACEDWNKIKELGGTQADALLAQYYK
jgi:tetratricopeptide (TPR) repeat protein